MTFKKKNRSAHKSSKKLLEQCQKLDKIWGHVFSAVITLTAPEAWYRKLRELIDRQQQGPLWMSQIKVMHCCACLLLSYDYYLVNAIETLWDFVFLLFLCSIRYSLFFFIVTKSLSLYNGVLEKMQFVLFFFLGVGLLFLFCSPTNWCRIFIFLLIIPAALHRPC